MMNEMFEVKKTFLLSHFISHTRYENHHSNVASVLLRFASSRVRPSIRHSSRHLTMTLHHGHFAETYHYRCV